MFLEEHKFFYRERGMHAMTMPLNLVLVRHGESEGNVAMHFSKRGDHTLFSQEFMNRHSSTWRLTDTGIAQAELAGFWIRKNIGL